MMAWILAFLSVLGGVEPERGIASNFGGRADKWRGGKSKCLGRKVRRTDRGIAMRGVKCFTKVVVINPRTRRAVQTVVLDAGPYGAVLPHSVQPPHGQLCKLLPSGRCWYVKKRHTWPGRWRGIADLTYALADELGHNGFEKVIIVKIGGNHAMQKLRDKHHQPKTDPQSVLPMHRER